MVRKAKNIIWMAVSWALWFMRNKIIFEGWLLILFMSLAKLSCYLGDWGLPILIGVRINLFNCMV